MTSELSEVQQFYCGSTVLITGGSGFVGKVLIEKLLRACPQLHQIVLLMRPKRGTESWQRRDVLMEDELFKGLSQENRQKVAVVPGDIQLPDLGLTNYDRQNLIDTVDIVFHVAATINFDEGMVKAVATNVGGTKAMLDLARVMTNIKAFVHVSTAFSNCDRDSIDEKFYPPKYNPIKLIRLTEAVDEPYISQLTPILLDGVPNTYIYTKAAAEDLVRTHSHGLPVSVFRPSVVMSTKSEPVAGWSDNPNGTVGLLVAYVLGALRSVWCDKRVVVEIVPVDMVVNALIATAWRTHTRFKEKNMTSIFSVEEPQVFNYVSSVERPITWSRFLTLTAKHHVPSVHAMWIPLVWNTSYKTVHEVQHVFLHLLPAYTIDTTARVFGKRTGLVKMSRKLEKMTDVFGHFMNREWTYSNLNTQQLWLSLSPQDRQLFPFSFTEFDWDSYFKTVMFGVRKYLLKDDLSTLPRALKKYKRFYWMHSTLKMVLFYMVARYVWQFFDITTVFTFFSDLVFISG